MQFHALLFVTRTLQIDMNITIFNIIIVVLHMHTFMQIYLYDVLHFVFIGKSYKSVCVSAFDQRLEARTRKFQPDHGNFTKLERKSYVYFYLRTISSLDIVYFTCYVNI